MSNTKFKVGDRVFAKDKGEMGTIKDIHPFTIAQIAQIYGDCPTGYHYDVEFGDGSIDIYLEGYLDDPKTAFLTELKELLEKYDAKIVCKYDPEKTAQNGYIMLIGFQIGENNDFISISTSNHECKLEITDIEFHLQHTYDKGEQPLP